MNKVIPCLSKLEKQFPLNNKTNANNINKPTINIIVLELKRFLIDSRHKKKYTANPDVIPIHQSIPQRPIATHDAAMTSANKAIDPNLGLYSILAMA